MYILMFMMILFLSVTVIVLIVLNRKKIDKEQISSFFKFLSGQTVKAIIYVLSHKIRFGLILGAILLVLFAKNLFDGGKIWVNIPPGYRGVVFNKFGGGMKDKLMGEGSNFCMPFLQSVYIANLTRLSAKIDNITADSKEFQDVVLKINVEFSLQEENLLNMYRKYGMKSIEEISHDIIEPNVNESVKNIIISYPVFEVLSYQSKIKDELKKNLKTILDDYYITVYDVDVENILISSKFRNTLAESELARKKKEAEEILLEQTKLESARKLVEADNEKRIKILEAEGIAEYNRLVSRQKVDANIIELKKLDVKNRIIDKWDGKLPGTTGDLAKWPFD